MNEGIYEWQGSRASERQRRLEQQERVGQTPMTPTPTQCHQSPGREVQLGEMPSDPTESAGAKIKVLIQSRAPLWWAA